MKRESRRAFRAKPGTSDVYFVLRSCYYRVYLIFTISSGKRSYSDNDHGRRDATSGSAREDHLTVDFHRTSAIMRVPIVRAFNLTTRSYRGTFALKVTAGSKTGAWIVTRRIRSPCDFVNLKQEILASTSPRVFIVHLIILLLNKKRKREKEIRLLVTSGILHANQTQCTCRCL